MKAILCEIRQAIIGRWFFIATLGTVIFLWLGLGTDSYYVLQSEDFPIDIAYLLQITLQSESTALSLPALAALPAAAAALTETRTGIFRSKVFRVGRRSWRVGKITSCALSAALSQLFGLLIFTGILSLLVIGRDGEFPEWEQWQIILCAMGARLLAAMFFACIGSVVSVLTGSSASAYIAPMAICFTLKLLGSRFFLDVRYVNPAEWLSGEDTPFVLLLILCTLGMIIQDISLRREMKLHA